jgi:hypothetical protein
VCKKETAQTPAAQHPASYQQASDAALPISIAPFSKDCGITRH